MAASEEHVHDLQPGERDPRRPPGIALVVIAFVALGTLAYVLYPGHRSIQPAPSVAGGGPSANTNPSKSPTGK